MTTTISPRLISDDLHAELAQARERSGLFDMASFARDLSALLQRLAGEHGWQGLDIA